MAPLASRTVTLAPASPWPLSTVAALLRLRLLAASGACRSGACRVAASETLPAASAWVTIRFCPLATAGEKLTLNRPLLSTVAVPSKVPCTSVTRTVAPTSPWPVSVLPVALRFTCVGASGAVVSLATIMAGTEGWLSTVALALTCKIWALSWAFWRNTRKVPSLPTVALPSVVPPEVTVISEPTVPWPVSRKPSALMARAEGVATSVPVGPASGISGDSLPAGSITTTSTVSPDASGGATGITKVPSGPAVTVPRTVSSGLRTSTVLPGSAVPPTVLPSGLTVSPVAGSGLVVSGAVTETGAESLPAASVTTTVTVWPLFCGVSSGTLKLPSGLTATVITLPAPSLTVTELAPGALPVTAVPSLLTATSVGSAGGVMSGARIWLGCEMLPAASVSVTSRAWPSNWAGDSGTVKLPPAGTTTVPTNVPSASFTSTVAPASPVPWMALPPGVIVRPAGAAGAVLSSAVNVADGEALPPPSISTTDSTSPLVWAGESATSNVPSAFTGMVPSRLPAASRTSTVLPASPCPLSSVPVGSRPSPCAGSGASKSGAVTVPAGEPLPLLSA
ncbi:hypothetical protein D3C80_1011280 [compost metagenome]